MHQNSIACCTILLLALGFAACEGGGGTIEPSAFRVLEDVAGSPVSGASVTTFSCTSKDWLGNCNAVGSQTGSGTTNSDGQVFFQSSVAVGTLRVKKGKYWDHENPNPGYQPDTYLTPIATLKVHVIKVNQHPAGYILNLVGQPGGCNDCIWETKQVGQPLDTFIYLKGGGYYGNSVGWYMTPGSPASGSSTPTLVVNRFDTAHFEVRY
jgi:hypothetical protein